MKSSFRKMFVGLIGASFLVSAVVPVTAAPIAPSAQLASNENVQQVRDDRWRRGGGGHWRGDRNRHRWDGPRRGPRHGWNGPRYRNGYWNGHRGYRDYRRGYRRHNDGWWYPLAAFGAGAIIGGAITAPQPQRVYRAPAYNNSHVQWCYSRYRSYRASDNTFQPYNGPRQQCYSPYR
ncbi:BA14K family protein [Brucellaceae bacterium D45D]